MIRLIILSLFFSISTFTFGQNISNYTRDTTLVHNCIDSAIKYVYYDFEKADYFINKLDSISEAINYNKGRYKAEQLYAVISFMNGDYEGAMKHYQKGLDFRDKDDKNSEAKMFTNMAMCYSYLNKYDSAIYYLDSVTSIIDKHEYPLIYVEAIFNKASIRIDQEDYIKALEYIEEGNKELVNTKDSTRLMQFYSTIGAYYKHVNDFNNSFNAYQKSIIYDSKYTKKYINYFNIGYLYMRLKQDYDSALYYCFKGIEATTAELSKIDSISINVQLGNIFYEKGYIDSSAYYYLQVFNNRSISNYPQYHAAILINLGLYYQSKYQYEKATNFYLEGKEIAKKYGFLKYQENALEGLASIEAYNKNYEQAYQYYNEYNEIRDSLNIEEAIEQASEMEYRTYLITRKYKTEKLEEEIKVSNRKIIVQRIGLLVFILFLAMLILILILVNKSKKKINVLNVKLNQSVNELTKLSLFKKNMTNMIVHDLKNPLNTILNAEIINDKVRRNNMVQQSGYAMLRLVENILSIYKYENSKMELKKQNISLVEILNNSIKEIAFTAEKKFLTIIISDKLNSVINVDPEIIKRVFVNLLSNAIKFSPSGNKIDITARINEESITISVINQGSLIKREYYDIIFEPFGQAEKKSSGKIASTGLGLAFCKMAIEAHNGDIGVNSDENIGTEFWFKLPGSFIGVDNEKKVVQTSYTLRKEEKDILIKYAIKLSVIEIYEISDINTILSEIENENTNINSWITQIKETLYRNDSLKYNELVNLILE